jgi:uncharacterized membrane protein
MNRARQRVRDEHGAVLVAGLLLTLALLIVIGAAVDIGRAFIERRELVSLADGAALSGSQALDLWVPKTRLRRDSPCRVRFAPDR